MNNELRDAIQKAFEVVESGIAKRVDDTNGRFKVYRAGTIIRIDIKVKD
ncbi:hypothetical protein LCGC14_1037290 [marine sediment metagenome]|uniref:Uncharacterized protein n=1 Tax=marine sediment metagenome TaxID=412755 RepID=A0A0F9QYZ1_9ZZZZ